MEHFQSKGTDWIPLYEIAMLETDAGKLPEKITIARGAILDRIEESLMHPLPGEQRAMDDALRNLRKLAQVGNTRGAAENTSCGVVKNDQTHSKTWLDQKWS